MAREALHWGLVAGYRATWTLFGSLLAPIMHGWGFERQKERALRLA